MKKIATIILLFTSIICNSQNIKIYHGKLGSTEFIEQRTGNGTQKEITVNPGDRIEIDIINPHPPLYEYNFQTEIIKESPDEITGSSELVSLLNNIIKLQPTTTAKVGTRIVGERYEATGSEDWKAQYLNKIATLQKEIVQAKSIIEASDNTESLPELLDNTTKTAGFDWARTELKKLTFFNNSTLEAEINSWKTDIPTTANGYNSAVNEEKLTLDIYSNYAQTLLTTANQIKAAYSDQISNRIKYFIVAGDSIQKVHLSIKNKSTIIKGRQTGEKILTLIIKPNFKRPKLEFVPVLSYSYTSDVKKYSLQNNVIKEEQGETWRFRPGGFLNFNLHNFGERKQNSIGLGAGFIISEKGLDSFYGSLLFSIKTWARIGAGFGSMNVPSHLEEGAQKEQPLPANVSDINDIIGYNHKPTFFFTIVIPGLNLPILK